MKKTKTEILFGLHPVYEALKARRRTFFELYIAEGKSSQRINKVIKVAEASDIPVKTVAPDRLEKMAVGSHHQGICAVVTPYPLVNMADIDDMVDFTRANCFLLLLDNVVDPHNLGALTRTALCAGVDGIIVPKDRSALPTPAVSRASAGAVEHISIVRVTNMANTVKTLKRKGLWMVGLDSAADGSIFQSDLTGSIGLVVGGEEKGIRPLVKKQCDVLMRIPQSGRIDSLNASVAGAVAMYEAFRQRTRHESRR